MVGRVGRFVGRQMGIKGPVNCVRLGDSIFFFSLAGIS